jgi:hypothetical protein
LALDDLFEDDVAEDVLVAAAFRLALGQEDLCPLKSGSSHHFVHLSLLDLDAAVHADDDEASETLQQHRNPNIGSAD